MSLAADDHLQLELVDRPNSSTGLKDPRDKRAFSDEMRWVSVVCFAPNFGVRGVDRNMLGCGMTA